MKARLKDILSPLLALFRKIDKKQLRLEAIEFLHFLFDDSMCQTLVNIRETGKVTLIVKRTNQLLPMQTESV